MNNNSYRFRRNNVIKNVVLVVLAIAVLILLAFVLRGCEFPEFSNYKPTTNQVSSDNSEVTSAGFCACDHGSTDVIVNNTLDCTCGNKANNCERDELAAQIAELQKENNKLKAENETLKSASDKSNIDLSNYILKSEYTKLSNSYVELEKKYNNIVTIHNKCGNIDLSQYVKKADYDALKKMYDELSESYKKLLEKYNELVEKYNALLAKWNSHTCSTGTTTIVNADHSNCVSKSEYAALLEKWNNHKCSGSTGGSGSTVVEADHSKCVSKSEHDKLQKEFADFKASHTSCVSKTEYNRVLGLLKKWEDHVCSGGTTVVEADHSTCVSLSDYKALQKSYNELEDKYDALLEEWNSHTCSDGTTVVEADHSSCVSLSDYKALLAKYNALLEKPNSNEGTEPIYVDEDGNEIRS